MLDPVHTILENVQYIQGGTHLVTLSSMYGSSAIHRELSSVQTNVKMIFIHLAARTMTVTASKDGGVIVTSPGTDQS